MKRTFLVPSKANIMKREIAMWPVVLATLLGADLLTTLAD